VIFRKNTVETLNLLSLQGVSRSDVLAIIKNRDYLDTYKILLASTQPKFTLFPDERQIRRAVSKNKVLFEDKFIKQVKNADY